YGPYEEKVVLEQGPTAINGPHQGAWVEAKDGSSWFLHFQDRGAWGRVVLLEPMQWINEWPEIGHNGHPVISWRDPLSTQHSALQTSDDFNGPTLGLQWQWEGNPPSLHNGRLRLTNGRLLQKLIGPSFRATTRIDASGLKVGERAGLIVTGDEHEALVIERTRNGLAVRLKAESRELSASEPLALRVDVSPQAVCRFSFSRDGKTFQPLSGAFIARPGHWIGATVGLFASGKAEFDDFVVEPSSTSENAALVVGENGDYKTIQAAIDALPKDDTAFRTILIRNGVYREKVMLAKNHVALVGEDRDKTRIEFAELRRNWRASHPDDWGAAVINIDATDVVVANLTVHNDYGGDHDHQFAIRSMDNANRIAILHANVIAGGGDTLSLWNSESGLSYYADSYFEGYVDYVCPRGWAYVTNSRFFGHNTTASIWHDGSKNPSQKFVMRHSSFDGVPSFALGRNHRDAQFYLIDDRFSATMADKPIGPTRRVYYFNDHRDGGDFAWFADNLRGVRDEDIGALWALGGQWDPATLPPLLPMASMPRPENGWRWVDPAGVELRWTPGRNAREERVWFGIDPVALKPASPETGPLEPGKTYYWRVDDGDVWSFRTDPRTVRIALAGDSTMTEKSGYGSGLKSFVEESAAFLNAARSGRSSKSYAAEGHWKELLRHKPTHILIQFGHNDVAGKGLDRETDLPTFRANMARYADEARAAGAMPILVTPLVRRSSRDDLNGYAEQTRAVAAEKHVPLIDLHAKSIELLDRLGPSAAIAISPLKPDGTIDKTHLNAAGSALFGALVAEELRRVVPELAAYVRRRDAAAPAGVDAGATPWSVRVADAVMQRTPNPLLLDVDGDTPKWDYTQGLVLYAIQQLAQHTGDERYAKYVKAYYDGMIDAEGRIRGYKPDELSLDRINPGKPLFALSGKEEKFRKAIETLQQQLREQPRNADGGFWHKKRYPHQMWLDGLYMAAPFLAQYAKVFHEPAAFDDVIAQFVLMEKHARDEKTGLLVHGYDDARAQKWADPKTGKSPMFWGRAMG
ncbi:MAG TPA: pectinesterase family protein, partial [Thermoanaerobaculia bacterium]|nr:pectinesterase family protein [Thermoanaerobaculia bacterium]